MTTASDDMKDRHPEKRSKLDEIVEETMRDWTASGGMDTELFKRIAERSFRYGVERAQATPIYIRIEEKDFKTTKPPEWEGEVQPAPAGEEKRTTGLGTVNHSGFMGCRCMRAKDAKYPSSFWACGDDRKGERRKGQESLGSVHGSLIVDPKDPPRKTWQRPHDPTNLWRYDQRCSDRRKPMKS